MKWQLLAKKLEDEEIASYILTDLDMDFNLVVSAMHGSPRGAIVLG